MKTAKIECQNPKCRKVVEVPRYRQKTQKYCCKGCASSVKMSEMNRSPQSRERSRKHMHNLNDVQREDPAWIHKQSEAASANLKKMWKNESYRDILLENSSKVMKRNWENPDFREDKISLIVEYSQSEEGRKKSSRVLKELWKNKGFQELRKELGRKQFTERNKLKNYNYPKAQKLLFDGLLPFIPDLIWEHEVVRKIYVDSFYYLRRRLDIVYLPLKIDIEVDGWSHEEESDSTRDEALISDGWLVIRVKNEDVLNNKRDVIYKLLTIVHEEERRDIHENYLQKRESIRL